MKRLDIFKSEGGYRLALGIYNDCPVIDRSPWYETKDQAERAKNEAIAEDERQEKIKQLIEDGDIDGLEALNNK